MDTLDSNGYTAEKPSKLDLPPAQWSLHELFVMARAGETIADAALLVFMFVVGMIPVAVALGEAGPWGTEPTLGLLLAIFSLYQFFRRH
jgi:hypothetical protein